MKFPPHRLARALAAASLLTLAPLPLLSQSLPTGPVVVAGQARIATQGNAMTVTNSAGAIVNWSSFNIGASNSVRFQQPDATSQVLNRVTGNDPSTILGQLSSNGRVWLLNPNGVLFGQGARVDVGGLVASTLRLNDHDWLAGRYNLTGDGGSNAQVINRGELRTSFGGQVALFGAAVSNEGLVQTPGGQLLLAAGQQIDLVDTGAPNLGVRVQGAAGTVTNLGELVAAGGRIDIHAASVNQQGIVRADSLQQGAGGEIVIKAANGITLGAASQTTADGAAGGQLTLDAGAGRLSIDGTLSARGTTAAGGGLRLFGREVGLFEGARIDASGATAGGEVLAGGGLQGRDARFANAQALYFAPGASIRADATDLGRGGSIVLWSDNATRAFGALSARGGARGGDGGFIETSGGWLDARPRLADVAAPNGAAGRWLLDPYNLTINSAANNDNVSADFTATASGATVSASVLQAALNAGTNVVVSTGGAAGNEAGHVTISGVTISVSASSPGSLTVIADGRITTSGSSIGSSGPMPLTMLAGRAGPGGIDISSTSIHSGGGSVVLGGYASAASAQPNLSIANASQGSSGAPDGVWLNSTTINAGTGDILIKGIGDPNCSCSNGVLLNGGTSLSGRNIAIQGHGSQGRGVYVNPSTITATQSLLVDGVGIYQGAQIGSGSTLAVLPSGGGSSGINIWGRSAGYDQGVMLDASGNIVTPLLRTTGGAQVAIHGNNTPYYAAAVHLTGGSAASIDTSSGAGAITIDVYGSGNRITLSSGSLLGGAMTLIGRDYLTLSSVNLQASKAALLFGNDVTLSGSTLVQSAATGDAIVIAGSPSTAMSYFNNTAAGAVLSTPSGRWITYHSSLFDGEGTNFHPGALPYDFKRHDSAFGGWQGDSGKGFVFANPQVANVSGSVLGKVYDGGVGSSYSGVFASTYFGDQGTLRFGVDVVFVDKHAGASKAVTFSAAEPMLMHDSNSKPVYGYRFNTSSLSATITPRATSVGGLQVVPKVYDGTTEATLGGSPIFSVVPGDSVTLGPGVTAAFQDRNVGVGKPVALTGVSLGGADGGNYVLGPVNGLTGTITPRPITLAGLVAANKVYDATAAATLSGAMSVQTVAGDVVTVSGTPSGQFVDKNVGVAKPVQITGITLGGANAGNYTVTGAGGVTADITPRELTVSGVTAASKVYDGTTNATIGGFVSITPLPGDSVSLAGGAQGRFADKNVGIGKAVTLDGLSLSGLDAPNYKLAPVAPTTADITPRPITASGLAARNKVYDGTTSATFNGTATVVPIAGDNLSVAGTPIGAFADKEIGTNKPVTVSGLSLAGADAANYLLQPITGLSASITSALITISGLTANDKVYDGTTAVTITGTPVANVAGNDRVTVSGNLVARFVDKNAGDDKPVTVSGFSLAGPDAANYQLVLPTLTADITPRGLTVTGLVAASKVYDGTTNAVLSGSPSISALAGDVVTLGGTVSGRFADRNAGIAKPVQISGLVLGGADARNYVVAPLGSVTADITPLAITFSGLTALGKVYDGTRTAALTGTPTANVLPGDVVSFGSSITGLFADKNVGNAKAVVVSGVTLGGRDGTNYSLLPLTGLSASITPARLTVAGLTAQNKVYDGGLTTALTGTPTVAAFAGDVVTVAGNASGLFGDRNVGTNKLVNTQGLSLAGADAGNYSVAFPVLRADITPAALFYLADPTERLLGQPIGAVSGRLSGFAGGDTQASATNGVLSFSTTAVTGSPVGRYPVTGSGITASNYTLQQAPGNTQALAIVRLSPEVAAESGATYVLPQTPQIFVFVPPLPNPTVAGLADLVVPPPPGSTVASVAPGSPGGPGTAGGASGTSNAPGQGAGSITVSGGGGQTEFGAVRLSGLSPAALQDLLDARDRYKKDLFAEALAKLEQNPALADLRACASLKDAQAGTCLVTEEQKREQQSRVAVAPMPVPAPAPAAAPTPAPAATPPAPAPAAAPAAAPAPAVVAAAPAAPAAPPTFERRRVRSASLPQIERKVALLIGVDRYTDSGIPTLANANKDARTMGRLFESELGYETFVIPDASRGSVVAALNRLALELKPQDSVVIYYAGHGAVVESTKLGYWQLADADAKRPETWLSNADISRLVARIGASQVALISDSCYSGSLVAEERLRASAAPVDPVAVLTRKSVVVMSSGGNEPVFDDGKQGHSPFAFSLMNTLRQVQTWRPGGQVFERVRFAVARELPQRPQYGVSAAAGHQPGGDYLFEQRQLESTR